MSKVSTSQNDYEKITPDTCCFTTKKPFSRRSIRYNCFALINYLILAFYTILMVGSVVAECYFYKNDYSKLYQLLPVAISLFIIEIVVIPASIISCCIKKTIWPVIIINIVYIVIQIILILAILTN